MRSSRLGGRVGLAPTVLVVGVLGVLGVLSACSPAQQEDFSPGEANIDIDTPQLRQMKADAGIEKCRPGVASEPVNELPAITLPCFGGGPDVTLDKLAGPLVVSTWASWCGPCQEELPYYQRLAEDYKGKLRVLGIDYLDPQTERAMALLDETGATFPQLADTQEALAAQKPFPRLNGLPVMLLVDGDGKVTHVEIGEIDSYAELQGLVSRYLGLSA